MHLQKFRVVLHHRIRMWGTEEWDRIARCIPQESFFYLIMITSHRSTDRKSYWDSLLKYLNWPHYWTYYDTVIRRGRRFTEPHENSVQNWLNPPIQWFFFLNSLSMGGSHILSNPFRITCHNPHFMTRLSLHPFPRRSSFVDSSLNLHLSSSAMKCPECWVCILKQKWIGSL